MRKMNQSGELAFEDIASADFDPAEYGRSQAEFNRAIHAITDSGEMLQRVEVFRRAYSILGFKKLVAVSRLPLLRQVLDFGYRLFARFRAPLGRLFGRGCNEQCSL